MNLEDPKSGDSDYEESRKAISRRVLSELDSEISQSVRGIVEDITCDHRWNELREPAIRAGLRACWSEPILAVDGQVIGATARYFRQPTSPSDDDLQLLEHSAQLAGLAIERSRTTLALAESGQATQWAWNPSKNAG